MRRKGIITVTGVAVLSIIAAVAVTYLRGMAGDGIEIPVYRVEKTEFVRRVTAEGNLEAVESTVLSTPMNIRSSLKIAWLAKKGSEVSAGDIVIRFDPTDMENSLHDGLTERETVDNRVAKKKAEDTAVMKNLGQDAGLAEKELQYAREFQNKDPEIFSRSQIIESRIDQDLAVRKKTHAEEEEAMRRDLSEVDLDLLALERKKAEHKIEEAEKTLAEMEVAAPHDGIFVPHRHWRGAMQVGETVWPGQQIGEIPRLDAMEAKVYVLEADAAGLTVGCKGTVRLESYPDRPVPATVSKMAALAMPRNARLSPVQYFEVTLQLDKTDPGWMKPGQRVSADLVLDESSGVLAVPREAVFDKGDGARIVYRSSAWGFEEVEVELGGTALGRVVVTSGLEEGDVIALQDPADRGDGEEGNGNTQGNGPRSPGVGG